MACNWFAHDLFLPQFYISFFFWDIKFHDAIIAPVQLANKCRARQKGSDIARESFFASLYKVIYHCDGLLNLGF